MCADFISEFVGINEEYTASGVNIQEGDKDWRESDVVGCTQIGRPCYVIE